MKANGSPSPSSYLTCNLQVPGRGGTGDDGPPQPKTATCCTALHRGPGSTQPRFAPIRTPGSAALMLDSANDDHYTIEQDETKEGEGHQQQQQQKKMTKTPTKKAAEATKTMIKKIVRKCKSSVADVDASRIAAADTGTPSRLRRSGGVRREWSFEDLHGGGNNAA